MRRVFGLLTLLVAVLTGTVSSVAQNGLSSAKYPDANTSGFWGAARSVPSTMAPAANATIDNGTKATSAFQPPSAGVPGAGVALTSIPGFALGRTIQTAPIPTGITTGDFNRDGKTDWVVASGEGTLWLYLGNGDGTAQRPRAIWPGGKLLSSQISGGQPAFEPVPVALASGDLRNNGISDLIIAEGNDNNTVAVLLGNGDGNFQPAVRYQMNFVGTYIRVADLNNDGHPDLVIGGLNGGITVFLGDGSGKFSSAPFAFGLPSGPPAPSPDNYIAGLPTIFAIGDFDHDGIQDIAYSGEGGAWVLRGIGNGQFNAAQQLLSQRTCAHTCLYYSTSAAFIDADGDGFLDLVATDNVGRAYVFRNKGDGTFDPQGVSFTTGLVAGDISVADINHDGHPDLIMGSSFYLFNPLESPLAGQVATNSLAVAYGDGRGGFPSVHLFRGGTGIVSLPTSDLNPDGFF